MLVLNSESSVASKIAKEMKPKIINSRYIFLIRPCKEVDSVE